MTKLLCKIRRGRPDDFAPWYAFLSEVNFPELPIVVAGGSSPENAETRAKEKYQEWQRHKEENPLGEIDKIIDL